MSSLSKHSILQIATAKSAIYTFVIFCFACLLPWWAVAFSLLVGMNPSKTLSVTLDVGTDNQSLLDDPLYVVSAVSIIPLPDCPISSDIDRDGQINGFEGKTTTSLWTSMNGSGYLVPFWLICAFGRFIQLVRKYIPHSLLHFEDFGVSNAYRLLDKYRSGHTVFNDDVYVAIPDLSSNGFYWSTE